MAIEDLLRAFDEVVQRNPEAKLSFRLVGDGPRKSELISLARTMNSADRISFEERIPRAQVYERAREADVLVHALHNHPTYAYGISPNKIFDYFLAARPVIFASNAKNDPVEEASAGWSVPAEDVGALADALESALNADQVRMDRYGQNGREYVQAGFTYRLLSKRLATALSAITERKEIEDVF